jgi:hypothetical protein
MISVGQQHQMSSAAPRPCTASKVRDERLDPDWRRFRRLSAQLARFAVFRRARPYREANAHCCGKHPLFATELLGLSDQFFRRPLEMWMTVDRACYLDQRGHDVNVGGFCSRRPMSRNLPVSARAASA